MMALSFLPMFAKGDREKVIEELRFRVLALGQDMEFAASEMGYVPNGIQTRVLAERRGPIATYYRGIRETRNVPEAIRDTIDVFPKFQLSKKDHFWGLVLSGQEAFLENATQNANYDPTPNDFALARILDEHIGNSRLNTTETRTIEEQIQIQCRRRLILLKQQP